MTTPRLSILTEFDDALSRQKTRLDGMFQTGRLLEVDPLTALCKVLVYGFRDRRRKSLTSSRWTRTPSRPVSTCFVSRLLTAVWRTLASCCPTSAARPCSTPVSPSRGRTR